MNAKHRAALPAVSLIISLIAFAFLLFPMIANAQGKAGNSIQKVDLITTEDFIEYASINDENIHELYFSVILYEGTESCLMCHEDEAMAVLDMGHFKWEGQAENIVRPGRRSARQE